MTPAEFQKYTTNAVKGVAEMKIEEQRRKASKAIGVMADLTSRLEMMGITCKVFNLNGKNPGLFVRIYLNNNIGENCLDVVYKAQVFDIKSRHRTHKVFFRTENKMSEYYRYLKHVKSKMPDSVNINTVIRSDKKLFHATKVLKEVKSRIDVIHRYYNH